MHPKAILFFVLLCSPQSVPQNVNKMRQIIKDLQNQVFQIYTNITLDFISSIPSKEAEARRAIIEDNERNLEKFTAIKKSAEKFDVDVFLCLQVFAFEDAKDILSGLHQCIEDKAIKALNVIANSHQKSVDNFLKKLYTTEKLILNCESEESCIEDVYKAVESFNTVGFKNTKIVLTAIEPLILGYTKEIDICVEKHTTMNKAYDSANLRGFEECVEKAINENKQEL